jgi:hypothetical protein
LLLAQGRRAAETLAMAKDAVRRQNISAPLATGLRLWQRHTQTHAVLGAVEPADRGKAAGLFNKLRQLVGVAGVTLVVGVFTRTGSYAGPQQCSAGFAAVLTVSAFSLAGAAWGCA